MDGYKDIFFALSLIVGIWIMAIGSNPEPQGLIDIIMMILVAIYLIVTAVYLHKKGKRFVALSFIITALMPFLFYGQMFIINMMAGNIDALVFASNKVHVYVVYNIFRFLAITLSFICAVAIFIKAVKNFASKE